MDVFVIPIHRDRYELYCEPPLDAELESDSGAGTLINRWTRLVHRWPLLQIVERWRLRFVKTLKAAERGEPLQPAAPAGWLGRAQVRVTAWVAERVAEQRLLWRLRGQTEATAVHPQDMSFDQVMTLITRTLQRDHDRHRLWLIIDALGMILSWPLVLVPGPNVILYYFMVRVGGHWFSMLGARQGLHRVTWTGRPCASLSELRGAAALDPVARDKCIREVAARLRLQNLSRFFDRVAMPHA
jgi:hypothetical protein